VSREALFPINVIFKNFKFCYYFKYIDKDLNDFHKKEALAVKKVAGHSLHTKFLTFYYPGIAHIPRTVSAKHPGI